MLNLEIGVTGSCEVIGDREMLQIVFQNILMNAGQAMEGHGRIDVMIAAPTDDAASRWPIEGLGCPQTFAREHSMPFSRRNIAALAWGSDREASGRSPRGTGFTSTCHPREAPLFRWICPCRRDVRSSRGDAAGQ